MNQNDINRSLQQYLNDLDKQVRALQRLEVSPTLNVVTYSGTPTAGSVAVFTGAGTITNGDFATLLGITVMADGSLVRGVGAAAVREWCVDVASLTASQTITVDLIAANARRRYVCEMALILATAAANTRYATVKGSFAWGIINATVGVAATILWQDFTATNANNTITNLAAITDGVRTTIVADGTGGYAENSLYIRAVGPAVSGLTLTVTVT